LTADLLVRRGLVYDGTGAPPVLADVAVRDGRVTAIAPDLPAAPGATELDAAGRWVVPGFLDIHTHYDAEVELAPALDESLRHGVTTVLLGSCSLSMAMGDPTALADMFCRVEGIPRDVVLPLLERIKTWDGPAAYAAHLASLPLGPNVAGLLGHSTIRAAAMGLGDSVTPRRRPTADQQAQMEAWLHEALDAGFLGLSMSTLPWDKMDGELYRSRPMPAVFASWAERRRLFRILRERDAVLQAVPDLSTKADVILYLLASASFGIRRSLRTTLISMMDVRSDRVSFRLAGLATRLFNRVFGATFRLQALPEPFDVWADGIDLVVFEEFEAGTAAIHLLDEVRRGELLRDSAYRRRFRKQWQNRWFPRAFHRDLALATVLACPDASVVGLSFAEVAEARGVDPVDVFLDLIAEHGSALRWYSLMGNDRPDWLAWIVAHPDALIGFSDAGAHLRNMAHYSFPLRMLRLVRDGDGLVMPVERAVHRLTGELAGWLGVDAGILAPGRRADLVIVDPTALDARLDEVHEAPVPGMEVQRLVRRSDGVVDAVVVNGRVAWRDGALARGVGVERGFGRWLPRS
jgi:N-acyl-D-aspartate/D-glutamate deacylase